MSRRVTVTEQYKDAVDGPEGRCFFQIDRATQVYHLDIIVSLYRTVFNSLILTYHYATDHNFHRDTSHVDVDLSE